MRFLSKNNIETNKLAKDFLNKLAPKARGATVIGLFGDLGSGKTTFTQAVARELDIKEFVTSPTFVIEKICILKGKKFEKLIHIDAYRLESGKELADLGFKEIESDSKNLILIEWPERVENILPKDLIKINITPKQH